MMAPSSPMMMTNPTNADRMDAPHEAHLSRILSRFNSDLAAKYAAGQREHGGNLWQKPGMLDRAIEEAIDMVVYLYTLKEQCEQADKAL